ncbi:MAG: isoamylase early set domain-containing protein [Gemmataceae bacterium]
MSRRTRHPEKTTGHLFRLDAPHAERVVVTGSFCAWDPNTHVLKKHQDGCWETRIPLARGRHEYRFVVDGTWANDPTCSELVPTPYGSTNCVLNV